MSATERPGAEAAEIRLLATLFMAFAVVKILGCSLGFLSAIAAAGGKDVDASRTLYWIPQVLFYVLLLSWSWRLRAGEPRARTVVWALSVLSIVVWAVYNVLDFVIGPASAQPAMAIAIRLRLLLGGDVWDVFFPAVAILKLRKLRAKDV
jgi:hypothetical protein